MEGRIPEADRRLSGCLHRGPGSKESRHPADLSAIWRDLPVEAKRALCEVRVDALPAHGLVGEDRDIRVMAVSPDANRLTQSVSIRGAWVVGERSAEVAGGRPRRRTHSHPGETLAPKSQTDTPVENAAMGRRKTRLGCQPAMPPVEHFAGNAKRPQALRLRPPESVVNEVGG